MPVTAIAAVYDDCAIDCGRLKVSVTGSAGGHNGVASLLEHLGDGFVRYRLGIGPKQPPEMDLKDFVLSKFTPEQLVIIDQKLDHYVQGLELLLDRGADQAMNQLNRKDHMNPTKRNYRATFILDNRGKEDSVEQIIEGVKKEIAAVQGDVTAVENLGRKDFVRVTDRPFPARHLRPDRLSPPRRGPGPAAGAPAAQPQRLPHLRRVRLSGGLRPLHPSPPWPTSTKSS